MTDPSRAEPDAMAPRSNPGTPGALMALRDILWRILEAGGLFIGLIILVYLLLGAESGPFVTGVIANIGVLVAIVTPQALIGIAIVVAVTRVLGRR